MLSCILFFIYYILHIYNIYFITHLSIYVDMNSATIIITIRGNIHMYIYICMCLCFEVLNLVKYRLSVISFKNHAFGILYKKSKLYPRSPRFLLCYLLEFIVMYFRLRTVIHFELFCEEYKVCLNCFACGYPVPAPLKGLCSIVFSLLLYQRSVD